jgi:hypothetical protein
MGHAEGIFGVIRCDRDGGGCASACGDAQIGARVHLSREGIVTDAEIGLTASRKVTGADWAAQTPLENGWEANVIELGKLLIEGGVAAGAGKQEQSGRIA